MSRVKQQHVRLFFSSDIAQAACAPAGQGSRFERERNIAAGTQSGKPPTG